MRKRDGRSPSLFFMAHCRSGRRPGEVWFWLRALGQTVGLHDEYLLRMIHTNIFNSDRNEKEGLSIYLDRREREECAARDAGAEPETPRWKLMGFTTKHGFLAHCALERAAYERLSQARQIARLPIWKQFGFDTKRTYARERKRLCLTTHLHL